MSLRAGASEAAIQTVENRYLADPQASLTLLADLLAENSDVSVESRLATLRSFIRQQFAELFIGQARLNAGHRSSVALQNALEQLENWLYFNGLSHRPILALAGMFSAGKSQFLNAILGNAVLPVATTPTTAIPTYLMHGDEPQILALNAFNRRTALDAEALQAISHTFHLRYRLGFSHLIRRIQITTPQMPYRNLVFLDTPGYSKPDALQTVDNTDENLARQHLLVADHLLWLIDVEKGTLAQDDVAFLQSLPLSSPIFFVVNKADLKPIAEVQHVVAQVRQEAAHAHLPTAGVCAYDSRAGTALLGDDLLDHLQALDSRNKYADPWATFAQALLPLREELDLREKQMREALQMGNSLIIDHVNTPPEAKKALTDYVQNAKSFQNDLVATRRKLIAFTDQLERQVDALATDLLAHRPPKMAQEVADAVRQVAYDADRHLQTHGNAAVVLAPQVEMALRDWRRAADSGMAEGQFLLGICYATGMGCEQNSLQGVEWLRRAADQGYAGAQTHLGTAYFHGYGVPQNHAEGLIWYRKAELQNHAAALYRLGEAYAMGHGVPSDVAKATDYCRQAAELGHLHAQFLYGRCCEEGNGVPQNAQAAVQWYRRAAEQGYLEAQCYLGALYDAGRLVTANALEAAKWFRRAADQGHPEAQCRYGALCAEGKGVPQNLSEAAKWYRQAAEQEDIVGQYLLACCTLQGIGVAADASEAARWYLKAAEQGNAWSQFCYGELLEQGRGVHRDPQTAAHWYQKAAAQGHAGAQNNLGNLYLQGVGVPKDLHEARRWFEQAAAQGNAWGQYNLGLLYANGQGIPQDFAKARSHYEKAARQGHPYAGAALQSLGANP